jgi:hypothetical protein
VDIPTPLTPQAELAQSSDLVRESEYLSSPDPQSFSVLSLLARPFWWTLSTVLGTGSSSSSSSIEYGEAADQKEWTKRQGDYVVPDLVEVSSLGPRPPCDECCCVNTDSTLDSKARGLPTDTETRQPPRRRALAPLHSENLPGTTRTSLPSKRHLVRARLQSLGDVLEPEGALRI